MVSNTTIFSDLNVRLSQVDSTDTMVITDAKAVVQSVWRLFKTEEGEIPYYRGYGLNLKQFIQRPLTKITASDVFDHVKQKIINYEQRVEVLQGDADADRDNGVILLVFTLRVKATGAVVQLEPLKVPIGA